MFKFNDQGNTLIELLVTIFLMQVLILSLFEMYMTAKKVGDAQESVKQNLSHAHQAIHLLKEALETISHVGCKSLSDYDDIINHTPVIFNKMNWIIGDENSFTLRLAQGLHLNLNSMINQNTLRITNDYHLKPKQILIISDCQHLEMVGIDSVFQNKNNQEVNLVEKLRYRYDQSAFIGVYKMHRYIVKDTNHVDANGQAIKGLYQESEDSIKRLAVENIDHMQITYYKQDGSVTSKIDNTNELARLKITLNVKTGLLQQDWMLYGFF